MKIIPTAWCNPQAEQSDEIHPVVKINYLPRILAGAFYLLMSYIVLGEQLLTVNYSWIVLVSLLWPHLARLISVRVARGKRQEIINMHLDAIFSALMCLVSPTFYFIATVTALLCVNALFIGFFRLLITTLTVYALTAVIGYSILPSHDLLLKNPLADQLTALFIVIYFSSFAAMGYYLSRQMNLLNQQVESLSLTDPLTQCYNRLYLDQNLTKELHRSYRVRYPLTLIFADLDHFKKINDGYGHAAGDEILKQFVGIARHSIRDDVDWIARFGGEEFVIVLPNSNAQNGSIVAERIRASLNEHTFAINQTEVRVTCSFGVSSVNIEGHITEARTLLAQADNGLYQAKAKGRNRVEIVNVETPISRPQSVASKTTANLSPA